MSLHSTAKQADKVSPCSVHQKKYDPGMFTGQLKAWFAYRIEYFTALFFVKISILAFYRRLTPAPEFQLAIKVVAAVVATFTMSMVLVIVRALCKTLPQAR